MKSFSLFALVAGLLALAGCSSTPSKVDTGPVRARTFNFVVRNPNQSPDYADNRQAVHTLIQTAITKNLSARGVSRVDSGGDITVGYLVIVGDNASTAAINDYFSYGADSTALQDKAFKAYTGNKNPNYFEAGTLVVDLVDSKSFKLLKRNYATRPLLRDVSSEVRAERLQEVVDEILRDLRIAR